MNIKEVLYYISFLQGYKFIENILGNYNNFHCIEQIFLQNQILYAKIYSIRLEEVKNIPFVVIGVDHNNNYLIVNQGKVVNTDSKIDDNYIIKTIYIIESRVESTKFSLKLLLWEMIHQVLPHFRKIFLCNLFSSILLILITLISDYTFRIAIPLHETKTFVIMFTIFGIFAITFALIKFLNNIIYFQVTSNINLLWYKSILARIIKIKHIKDQGDANERFCEFMECICLLQSLVINGLGYCIQIPCLLIVMAMYSTTWTIFYLLIASLILVSTSAFLPFLFRNSNKQQIALGIFNNKLDNFLSNIEKIQTTNSEQRIKNIIARKFMIQEYENYKYNNLLAYYSTIVLIISSVGLIGFYFLVKLNPDKVETILTFSILSVQFSSIIQSIALKIIFIQNTLPSIGRINQLLGKSRDLNDVILYQNKFLHKPKGNININNLSFKYYNNNQFNLQKINIQIKAGDSVLLKGKSGAGKSTLVKIILGLELGYSGQLFFDDQELKNINTEYLRQNIGTVTQNDSFFLGTIYQNLTFGLNSKLELSEIYKILEFVDFIKDIDNMPLGLNTMINPESVSLSGGQKHKLFLARALLRSPSILILDEVTRNFDVITQKNILTYLKSLNITKIIISHANNIEYFFDKVILIEPADSDGNIP